MHLSPVLYVVALSIFEGVSALVAPVVRAPVFAAKSLGTSTSNFAGVTRDGGGGGVVNGKNIAVFSDTTITKDGKMIGFRSNTAVFSDASNPLTLEDFGSNPVPELAVPWEGSETDSKNYLWPCSSISTQSLTSSYGYAVFPVGLRDGCCGDLLYNTLVKVTASNSGPNITREVPQLFQKSEVQYGTFATTAGRDGYLYLFGSSDGGLKLARVPWGSATEKTKYTYWSSTTWSTKAASATTVVSAQPCGFSSGDVFFSEAHNTWVMVYMTSCADSAFYTRHSTTGRRKGPWSDQKLLYQTTPAAGQYNYGGHAYPTWLGDRSGKEVALSWTYNGAQIQMAKVVS